MALPNNITVALVAPEDSVDPVVIKVALALEVPKAALEDTRVAAVVLEDLAALAVPVVTRADLEVTKEATVATVAPEVLAVLKAEYVEPSSIYHEPFANRKM